MFFTGVKNMNTSVGLLLAVFMRLVLIILIFQAINPAVVNGALSDNILNNLRLTHINDLVETTTCPRFHYIIGLRLRIAVPRKMNLEENIIPVSEKSKKAKGSIPADDIILISSKPFINGFEITCSDGYHVKPVTRKITFGTDGKWSNEYELCKKGFAVGILYELLDTSNPAMTNINNMGIQCSGEPSSESETVEITDNSRISDKDAPSPKPKLTSDTKQVCEIGQAVDSIAIKADSIITIQRGDLFSITELIRRCSTVINPAHRCNLSFRWDRRRGVKCNNLADIEEVASKAGQASDEIKKNITCSVDSWTGVDFDSSFNNAERIFSRFETIGIGNDKSYVAKALAEFLKKDDIRFWFDAHLPLKFSHVDEFISNPTWRVNGTFSEVVEVSPELFTDPIAIAKKTGEKLLYSPSMYQLVAFCDIYKIGFSAFTAGIDVYYNTKINNRNTRISFLAFDVDS